jgi:hypothetical protein
VLVAQATIGNLYFENVDAHLQFFYLQKSGEYLLKKHNFPSFSQNFFG